MATAALLSQLLTYKTQLNQAEMEQIFWTQKYDSNAESLKHYEKEQAAWEKAYDKAFDCDKDKTIQYQGQTFSGTSGNIAASERYAEIVTGWTDDELERIIDGLTDLDCEYDQRKTALSVLIEELNANIEATKQQVGTEAQDTHLLGQ